LWFVYDSLLVPIFDSQRILVIDTSSEKCFQQHHINGSFISHQKPFSSPGVKTAVIEQTENFYLLIYLFSLSKHFLPAR